MTARVWLAAAVSSIALITACVTNPATGGRTFNILSEDREIALGKQSDAQIRQEMGVYDDPEWQAYVSRVGQAMAKQSHRPSLPWTFTVLDASAINAFALPGGYLYVTRGILPFLGNEAELANVLGHEIAHVTALHGANAYSEQVVLGTSFGIASLFAGPRERAVLEAANLATGLLFLKHGRDAELEADSFGVQYAAQGGWNPSGMAGMLSTLGRLSDADGQSRGVPNFLSTHPLPADRIEHVRDVAEKARTASSTRVNEDDFARRLDGLVFGDSREQGIVRGRDFLHPIMRIALTFPQGWTVSNGSTAVNAVPPQGQGIGMVLDVIDAQGRTPAQAGRAAMEDAGFSLQSGDAISINGLNGWAGVFAGDDGQNTYGVRAAFLAHAGRVYRIAGIAPAASYASAEPTFAAVIRSFRGMSQAEADAIQPARIDFYTARQGDTWESLAKSLGRGAVSANALAIMNGSSPSTPPAVGTRLRVVIGD